MESLNKQIEETSPLGLASNPFLHPDEPSYYKKCFEVLNNYDPTDDAFSIYYNPSDYEFPDNTLPENQVKELKRCPNCSGNLVFHKISDGTQIPIPCNKYSCPYCGMLKARKLYAAMMEFFKPYKYIRMWTLTYTAKNYISPLDHYKVLQEAWRRFITEIRRSRFLSKSRRNLSYIRVSEVHEGKTECNSDYINTGFIHFHILVTEYIDVKLLQPLWNHIIQEITGEEGKIGNVNCSGIPNHKKAAAYVCKYVMKSCKIIESKLKKWTKSGKLSLFHKKESSGEWILVNKNFPLEDQVCNFDVLAFYTCNSVSITSQSIESLPPPDSLFSGNVGVEISNYRKNSNSILN